MDLAKWVKIIITLESTSKLGCNGATVSKLGSVQYCYIKENKKKKRWTNFTLHIYFFNERILCNYIERENMVRSCLEACIHRRYSLKTVSCENIKINVIQWLCLKNKNKNKKFSWELSQKKKKFYL